MTDRIDPPQTEMEPLESVTVDILGNYLRVRVSPDRKMDVLRAAEIVQGHIDRLRKSTDPPATAIARAALELAYQFLEAQREIEERLERLLREFDDKLA